MASRRSSSVGSRDNNNKEGSDKGKPSSPPLERFHKPRKLPRRPPPPPRKRQPPQQNVDEFWGDFTSKTPGKVYSVLPESYFRKRLTQRPDADEGIQTAVSSYEEAARICREKVEKIVKECRRVNQKYRDPHFDVETELYDSNYPDCLHGLLEKKTDAKLEPKSVKRIAEIFTDPHFFIAGASPTDVRQGRNGDCWLMSAITTVSECRSLIDRICVARDEKVGVYGFVFNRDGAWISEVVDDKLFLIKEDYYDHDGKMDDWLNLQDSKDIEKEYKKRFQTGSKALYFAQCSDQNETWLPLLEKAFAKAHGDYLAIEGGFVGEAIEDLTGGVTSEVSGSDILDKDKFWREELMQVNKQFLFGCGGSRGLEEQRKGILNRHAYSIMEAREIDDKRLVKLRNPWGYREWEGPWSDGSAEWTGHYLDALNHKFGNDGVFWISYEDLLHSYHLFDRTRLFDETWTITQKWISLEIPWAVDYHDTYFDITISKAGPVVIVLTQLDDRYFRGLEGQYEFKLQFRLHEAGAADYLVRSPSSYDMRRSVSTEVDLEPGTYSVMVKISAIYWAWRMSPEEVVRGASRMRVDKLHTIGMSYDLAHSKVDFKAEERLKKDVATRERRAKRKDDGKTAFERHRKGLKKSAEIEKRKRQRWEAARKASAEVETFTDTDGDDDPAQAREGPLQNDSTLKTKSLPIREVPEEAETVLSDPARQNDEPIIPPPPSRRAPPPRERDRRPPPPPPRRRSTFDEQPYPELPRSPHSYDFSRPRDQGPDPRGPYIDEGDISWDSELDALLDTDDERLEPPHYLRPPPPPPMSRREERVQNGNPNEPFPPEPWNAVCVVGLRVYGQVGNEIAIKVVRPEAFADAIKDTKSSVEDDK